MKKIKSFIFLFIISFGCYAQVTSILIKENLNFNLDSIEKLSIRNPDKTYIIIYNRIDTNSQKISELIFGNLNKLKPLTNNFDVIVLYFQVPLVDKVCTNIPLKFIISKEVHDAFLRGTPACILFTSNKENSLMLDTNNAFKKFTDEFPQYPNIYKNVYLSIDTNEILKFVLSNFNEKGSEIALLELELAKIAKENHYLKSRIDSFANIRKEQYLTLNCFNKINNNILNLSKRSNSLIPIESRLISYQFTYLSFPTQNKNFGYSIGLQYSEIRGNVSWNNKFIVDTIDRNAYDSRENYIRIAYGKNLKEIFSIKYLSLAITANYRIPNNENSKWYLSFNPGIRISNILTAKYNATEGLISWGGLYLQPEYENNDTSFSGQYEFYQNKPIYKEKKSLAVNNTFLSGFISIDGFYSPFKVTKNKELSRFYINVGLQYEKSSNLLNNNKKESVLPYTIGDYNSLLYRTDKLVLNSISFKIGLSYKL